MRACPKSVSQVVRTGGTCHLNPCPGMGLANAHGERRASCAFQKATYDGRALHGAAAAVPWRFEAKWTSTQSASALSAYAGADANTWF